MRCTVPVGYASSLLGNQVGQASNATLYGVCMLSSLFIGPLTSSTLGPKWGLCFGMFCYMIYVLCFAVTLSFDEGSGPAWCLALGGSFIGGIGAGSLWTCQGAFFGAICEKIADTESTPLENITSSLSSTFAIFYLGQECFFKAGFTVLQKYLKVRDVVGFSMYAALALVALVVLSVFGEDVRARGAPGRPSLCAKASTALAMWGDPTIWLLSGSNFTFGFAAAYLNGYINSTWLTEALGEGGSDFIGFLGAVIALVATLSSAMYGRINTALGSKTPVFVFGSMCYFALAALTFITAPDGKGPGGWGWGIVVFYILHGLGRGVYESTNKGIFTDYYPGQKSMGAFANCMMQNTAAGTIGFIMGAASVDKDEVWVILMFSIATVPCLLLAKALKKNDVRENPADVS